MHWIAAFALIFAGYVLAGVAALSLSIPPGYASPLYPAAGVALAGLLTYGWRMAPAVMLGGFCVNVVNAALLGPLDLSALILPCIIGVGAGLQAGVGALLVRRFVRQPLTLSEPRDVMWFFAASVLSCTVNASLSNLGLWLTGATPGASIPLSVATWWIGDLLGVLIGTPIVLSLIGRPKDAWAPRRFNVGLPLIFTTLLLAVGISQVARWHNGRILDTFERDAASASHIMAAQLRDPLQAVKAMHSLFVATNDVSTADMRLASRDWLASAQLVAMGWSEWTRRSEIPAFEARMRNDGNPGYTVFDRQNMAVDASGDVLAIRHIEPHQRPNLAAVGLNSLSVPAARAAIEASRQSGKPVASAAFELIQPDAAMGNVGIVIYQAIFKDRSVQAEQPLRPIRGVVFVTLRPEVQLTSVKASIPSYLGLCLVDVSPANGRSRLAGPAGCDIQTTDLRQSNTFSYAGREWELQVFARLGDVPGAQNADVWLFALVGLLSAATLGGFLLILTGRTRRIETAVRERTAALQAEVQERESAQTELRESEQRFRNILNNVPIGVIYTDMQGNVKLINPRFCELINCNEGALLTLNDRDFTHPDDMALDLELTGQLVRGDIPVYSRHKRYVTQRGAIVSAKVTVTLLRDTSGQAHRLVGVVEDVTQHMKLEDAERAREAAELSNHAKSEFLSRMSHELRTPLNAMLGFAQLLELDQRNPLSSAQRPWISQIQQAGWHLLELINDVLDLSRIESGNVRLKTEMLDLNEMVDATRAMVQADARRRRITISQVCGAGAAAVLGDNTRVKQILTNLLSNAVKYNTDGGRVHIATRAISAELVEIAVTDTGLGMTPEQMSQLFQPFNRLGREKSGQEGTGIGLVISQRLAELMGGSLRARSIAGGGSSFILTLPCQVDPDTIPSDLHPLAPVAAEYNRRVVHYVEDNETNVEVMRGILAQRPQVDLDVSITGLDALAAIRARRPDLILLDMHLPDISGMELLLHFKADAGLAGIPVVVVSADALAPQVDAAFAAGCAHYLTKPVNVAELLKVVDELLERLETRFD